jgi:hypothetical protein
VNVIIRPVDFFRNSSERADASAEKFVHVVAPFAIDNRLSVPGTEDEVIVKT